MGTNGRIHRRIRPLLRASLARQTLNAAPCRAEEPPKEAGIEMAACRTPPTDGHVKSRAT